VKKSKKYQVRIDFTVTLPEEVSSGSIPRQIKENLYLYPGRDNFFFPAKGGSYVEAVYGKFTVSAKEVK